jgi:eukaryotic-like serine/threonine-protein kinase
MSFDPGARLGPYEIVSRAGAGGMGEVYRARDTRLDRTVAIKVLPPDLTSDSAARQRFEREARAVAALSHPHICPLFDIGQQDGTDYLVMEYLEGRRSRIGSPVGNCRLSRLSSMESRLPTHLRRPTRPGSSTGT